MSPDPTDRQRAVLAFIRGCIAEQGMPPTLQQIAQAFGFSAIAASKHVRRLEAAGLLVVLPHVARGIRIPDARPRHGGRLSLPVLGRVAAGSPIGADAGVDQHVLLDQALFSTRPDYLLRVKGDSMRDDGILDGDLVAVKRTREARNGQVVVARLDGELTIKRFEQGPARIRLLPRNRDYAPIVVPPASDFAIEGLYCGLVRPE